MADSASVLPSGAEFWALVNLMPRRGKTTNHLRCSKSTREFILKAGWAFQDDFGGLGLTPDGLALLDQMRGRVLRAPLSRIFFGIRQAVEQPDDMPPRPRAGFTSVNIAVSLLDGYKRGKVVRKLGGYRKLEYLKILDGSGQLLDRGYDLIRFLLNGRLVQCLALFFIRDTWCARLDVLSRGLELCMQAGGSVPFEDCVQRAEPECFALVHAAERGRNLALIRAVGRKAFAPILSTGTDLAKYWASVLRTI